jgi:hypothetical protein
MTLEEIKTDIEANIAHKRNQIKKMVAESGEGGLQNSVNSIVAMATAKFVNAHIAELQLIVNQLNQAIAAQANRSWSNSVDRQGGSFDTSELSGRDGWS